MTQSEKLSKLEQARASMEEAVNLVEEVFPNDENVQVYWIDQVNNYISCSDLDLDQLTEQVHMS